MEDIEKLQSQIKRLKNKVESQKRTIKALRYSLDMFQRMWEREKAKAITDKRCTIVELKPIK